MSEFKAIDLSDIDGGNIGLNLEQAINEVRQKVTDSWDEHADLSLAKGSVTLKVDISKHPEHEGYLKVDYQINLTLPKRPRGALTLVNSTGETFGINSGGVKNPKQNVLDFEKQEASS